MLDSTCRRKGKHYEFNPNPTEPQEPCKYKCGRYQTSGKKYVPPVNGEKECKKRIIKLEAEVAMKKHIFCVYCGELAIDHEDWNVDGLANCLDCYHNRVLLR